MLTEHGPDINFTKTNELHSIISLHVFLEYIGGSLNYCSKYIFILIIIHRNEVSIKWIIIDCMEQL